MNKRWDFVFGQVQRGRATHDGEHLQLQLFIYYRQRIESECKYKYKLCYIVRRSENERHYKLVGIDATGVTIHKQQQLQQQ